MSLPKEQSYTIDDIYKLPEEIRAELIDGKIYYMAAPNTKHQIISGELFYEIKSFIKNHNGSCKAFNAPFAVLLNEDDKNYVEPDISIICEDNKIDDKGCHGAPDWIIEIVSPSSKRMDYYNKLFKYRTAGVREYWIVDLADSSITVHFFEDENSPFKYMFSDKIKVNIYEDFYIDFSEINLQIL